MWVERRDTAVSTTCIIREKERVFLSFKLEYKMKGGTCPTVAKDGFIGYKDLPLSFI